jgi:nitrogen fixation NifU-like protein
MPNDVLAEHAANPRNIGDLTGASVVGRAGVPGEGPYMLIGLWVAGDRVTQARFETHGCPIARACGSWVTEWLCGRELAVAARLEPGDVERILGGLPLGKEHCAALPVNALRSALACVDACVDGAVQ